MHLQSTGRKPMHLKRKLATVLAVAALLPLPVANAQDAPSVPAAVDQGDRLLIQKTANLLGVCTVGYVDTENNRVWTDAHCGNDGAEVYDEYQQTIGTLRHVYPDEWARLSDTTEMQWSVNNRAADLAYVEISDPNVLGKNYFSQNSVAEPEVGDVLCAYGSRTQRIACSPITNISGPVVLTGDIGSDHGDSGGPAWVEGKGYIGQLLGADRVWRSDKGEVSTTVFRKIGTNDLRNPLNLREPLPYHDLDFDRLRHPEVTTTENSDQILREKAERDRAERDRVARAMAGDLDTQLGRARQDERTLEDRANQLENEVNGESNPERRQELERDLENAKATRDVVKEQKETLERTEHDRTTTKADSQGSSGGWLKFFRF
ncbi:hypothetical protein A4R63_09365 [Corynebacterium pseudotuberculosis]|nr:hypothetical protein CP31_09795 [Corynebacterium pseudotuberculosis 31]APB11643.1 hypothetical protein A4R72_09600 [Corynebacterium pseudotuberculosis]APB13686.1 hypothetical protein A4R71_09615 [Corynebacterium pseudotuberculosis]APB15730.1 hypothetical protein A4R68_09615 [Corynebacterium pseudotuberculosis]APB17774.1 hypothetical protein A4R67_09590 [Corynebacterium pseudotuberculosis]